ncbi:MAG: type IX secretion system sortase PorU [Flavobacteriales bacterium]|nr:type IX secretion system sortase PorU [Flavobacteriales bacterium]
MSFTNARYDQEKDYLAYYSKQIRLGEDKITSVQLIDVEYEEVSSEVVGDAAGITYLNNQLTFQFDTYTSRKVNYGEVRFFPLLFDQGVYKRVVRFKVKVLTQKSNMLKKGGNKSFTSNSVLATGDWYKIAVLKDGIFKIDYDFLKNLGLDIDHLNPNDFKLYGNGGKMLPALNSAYRPDDIQQNAVYVAGAADNSFDKTDYVLFYGQSPNSWTYNTSSGLFEHKNHMFSDTTYYFITFSSTGESPKRITTQNSQSSPNQSVTTFNDYAYHERDAYNLIKSGSLWLGDLFDVQTSYNYAFNFPNITNDQATVIFSVAARSATGSTFTGTVGGSSASVPLPFVNMGNYTSRYAELGTGIINVTPSSDVITLNLSYNKPAIESLGWLDEVEVNARRNLSMTGTQLFFRDVQSVGAGNVSTFTISNAAAISKVWEISDPFNIKEQVVNVSGNALDFTLATDTLRSFVAFTTDYETKVIPVGKVDNQNLHAIQSAEMVIVSHPKFLSQSAQIADFHAEEGLSVVIVTPQQIFNEYSSGSRDIVAIRDFVRMLYERSTTTSIAPKYLLLVGDGSYDNKHRITGNTNFIPTYQSPNSIDVIGSLVSDDYFGLLDPSEGTFVSTEYLDIGIGRLPVKTQEEADHIVHKILNYNTAASMHDWRNLVTFIGDDEDSNTHMAQANSLAGMVESSHKEYNINKIFFDAFNQESTPGGSRYPDVNKAINNAVENGSLIINYTGHGGEAGLAHERVLTVSDIYNWTNTVSYPLFVTATCELSRFDDPLRTSAGELMILSEHGALALLTTVRLVFSGPNFVMNQDFFDEVFDPVSGQMPTIGEVFMAVKNLNASVSNNRNFTLLGDPALRLAYPVHNVVTTQINGVAVSGSDTIQALQKITITGEVRDDANQKLSNFNGIMYPTVFDKEKQITALANDGGTPFVFGLQTSKLFKGKVSVVNGEFSYTFVVPKDIAYNYGQGKLSYYGENQVEDANGYYNNFYIGGTSSNYEADEKGPEIELFMNDENFVFGGMTDENPILLANIYDLHGINMVGNGIGHDIIAVLDNETEKSYILNDYYEAELNSYQSGRVYFPFEDLEEGRHTLTLKVWDVYNNSSEATIEFVVVKSKDIIIDKVYNYPNPFTTYTEFWFEHNQPGRPMYAQVQIFTVSGKLVKTLDKHILDDGYRSTSITWNGLDEYGDRIGRGVYVYRLKVRADNYSVAEKYEKLVILQ